MITTTTIYSCFTPSIGREENDERDLVFRQNLGKLNSEEEKVSRDPPTNYRYEHLYELGKKSVAKKRRQTHNLNIAEEKLSHIQFEMCLRGGKKKQGQGNPSKNKRKQSNSSRPCRFNNLYELGKKSISKRRELNNLQTEEEKRNTQLEMSLKKCKQENFRGSCRLNYLYELGKKSISKRREPKKDNRIEMVGKYKQGNFSESVRYKYLYELGKKSISKRREPKKDNQIEMVGNKQGHSSGSGRYEYLYELGKKSISKSREKHYLQIAKQNKNTQFELSFEKKKKLSSLMRLNA